MAGNDGSYFFVLIALIVGVWGANHRVQQVEKRLVKLERELREKGVLSDKTNI